MTVASAMSELKTMLERVLALQAHFSSTPTPEMTERGELISKHIPHELRGALVNNPIFVQRDIRVAGKDATGRKSRVPWVRLYDPALSPRPTEGYYLVFLFACDGSAVYLSLNQGTIEFQDGHHVEKDSQGVAANAQWARTVVGDAIRSESRFEAKMALADRKLGSLYENGNIASFKYPIGEIPNNAALAEDIDLMLGLLDRLYGFASPEPRLEPSHPAVVCEPKRLYSATDADSDLFLPSEQITQILRLVLRKHNLVLQGPPGVGKTFAAKRLAYALIGEEASERVAWVQFHQSYSYEDFLEGYRPDAAGGFSLSEGLFFKFCKTASNAPERKYVFIIDEINRGNLSKIFGEVLSLVEGDKRGALFVTLPYSGKPFSVPKNLYIFGLMNTADRSLAVVDYALRRRFVFIDVEPQFHSEKFAEHLARMGVSPAMTERIRTRLSELNSKIGGDTRNLGKGFEIGHSFFCPTAPVADESEWYEDVVHHEVLPLLREYWFDSPKEVSAAESILLP